MNIRHSGLAALLALMLAACGASAPRQTAQLPGGDESGIGGTGMLAEESGIGGTGIVGEITGFGSIFVNGEEVEITAATRITVDGEAVARHDFAIGEVVALRAVPGPDLSEAAEAHLRHEAVGPVAAVDAAGRAFTLLGQRVVLARGDLPEPGAWVAVSGFRDGAGTIHATAVRSAAPGEALVVGVPRRDGEGWHLGALRLRLPDAPPGGEVRLRGRPDGSWLQVTRMQGLAALPFRAPVTRLLVQGFVRPLGGGRFGLDGIGFRAGEITLPRGRPVRLELQRGADGWRLLRPLPAGRLPMGRPRPDAPAPRQRNRYPTGPAAGPGGRGGMPRRYGR